MIAFELSLLCNSQCAMCCAHSPEYTEEYRKLPVPVNYEAIERTIELLQPGELFFQGGEVLVDKASLTWLEGLRKKHSDILFRLATNGNVAAGMAQWVSDVFDSTHVDFYGFQDHTYRTVTCLPLRRSVAFAERLLELAPKRVILKYLCTPINFHEAPLFLEWALRGNPQAIVVRDAHSETYIRYDKNRIIPRFSPYTSPDEIPNAYWSRIIQRTLERIERLTRRNREYCEVQGIDVCIIGGLFDLHK